MSDGKTKALTVRLPVELYEQGRMMARRRRMSLNRFLQEGLRAALWAEEQKRLYAAFGDAGRDSEADVEFTVAAQAEVLDGEG